MDRGAWQAHISPWGCKEAVTKEWAHTHTHIRNIQIDRSFNLLVFPGSSDGRESACKAGDPGSIPELGRAPGEGSGNPQYSCLENSMD